MIVVSNTSPLTNLAAIGHFDLLRRLFGEIHISQGVWEELNAGGLRHPGNQEVENAAWVHRHRVVSQALVHALRRDLDLGEAETLDGPPPQPPRVGESHSHHLASTSPLPFPSCRVHTRYVFLIPAGGGSTRLGRRTS